MTFAANRLEEGMLTSAVLPTTFSPARQSVVPSPLQRATLIIGDLFAALGLVLCIPLVILAIGMPIALFVRLLLWIGGLL